jgi:hypothetical protein
MTLKRHQGTFELILSLFILVLLLLGIVVWGLLPEIKSYLHLQEEVGTKAVETARLQRTYDGLYAQKEKAEAEEAAMTEQFENPADTASVAGWIKSTWPEADVTVRQAVRAFEVQAVATSPASFYRFVNRFDTAPWVLALGNTVTMAQKGGKVVVTFSLRTVKQANALSVRRK